MVDPKYRTFWRRFWAGIVDVVVFLPVMALDYWMYQQVSARSVLAAWLVISSLVFSVYSVLMHGKYGQTVGKMLTGVKVLDLSELKLSMTQAFLRDSVLILLIFAGLAVDVPRVLGGLKPNPYQEPMPSETSVLAYASLAWFLAELTTMLTAASQTVDMTSSDTRTRTVGDAVRCAQSRA